MPEIKDDALTRFCEFLFGMVSLTIAKVVLFLHRFYSSAKKSRSLLIWVFLAWTTFIAFKLLLRNKW